MTASRPTANTQARATVSPAYNPKYFHAECPSYCNLPYFQARGTAHPEARYTKINIECTLHRLVWATWFDLLEMHRFQEISEKLPTLRPETSTVCHGLAAAVLRMSNTNSTVV